jgi:hypothetical protein
VQQRAFDRLILPVDDHRLDRGDPGHFEVEDGVVAGVGVQDLGDDARVHGDGDGSLPGPVYNGGNLAFDAHAACGVLVELALAGRCDYGGDGGCCHVLFLSGTNETVAGC